MQTAKVMQYHICVLQRLLASLPPSMRYVQSLTDPDLYMDDVFARHTLRWAPRFANKTFAGYTKVC